MCVFNDDETLALGIFIKGSPHRDIFLLGHGVLNESGEETFANGKLYYRAFDHLAKVTDKRVTILSCRGTIEDGKKAFHLRWEVKDYDALERHRERTAVRSLKPHKEGNLWVYGEHGKAVMADLRKQLLGWREAMNDN